MRFFLPISAALFLAGLGYYGYTYYNWGRLHQHERRPVSVLTVFTFLIGIVSEQISALHYKDIQKTKRVTVRKD